MKANPQVLVRTFCLTVLLALGACAKGASTFDDTANATCGNGIVDTALGETCDTKLPMTMTCTLMTGGAGVVVCDPATCRLTTMCTAATGVSGSGM